MSRSILITGASGYLGGSLLTQLSRTKLPPYKKLYALVRSQQQADAITQYGGEPLFLDIKNEDSVLKTIVEANISIVYFLIDALKCELQMPLIKALGKLKKQTGQEAVMTNNTVIETAESHGVRSYIFVPCIVYGEGEGFGNRIFIQTTDVVKAAKKVGAVYNLNSGNATWPVSHIRDNTAVYVKLLESILSENNPGHGKDGYYLASSGSVAWIDIYGRMAEALAKRGVIESSEVKKADDAVIGKIGEALRCPKELVAVQIGGTCTFSSERASRLGWKAEYPPEHILEAADTEVELILKHLKG